MKEQGRIYEKGGKTIALIRPGEQLRGLVELGILPREVPFSELQVTPEPKRSVWPYILLGLLIALAFSGLYRLRRIFSDPATSGQPVIRGGLPASRPRDVENQFQRIVESRIASGDPAPQWIGPIEEGFLSGYGRVQYRDRSEMKRLNREPAYRARFRFANGTEEDLFFLQRCANDVVLYHTRYIGFRFEPGRQVVVEPLQTVTRTPLRVATASGAPVTETKLEIAGMEITAPEGSIFVVAGDKVTINVSRGGDITVGHIKKVKKAKAVRPVTASQVS